jgi:hypothetical protein
MITQKIKTPMKITTPEVVWEKCALDIVGPLSQTSGEMFEHSKTNFPSIR